MQVLRVCGSLRSGSWNRKLLEALPHHAPERMTFVDESIADLPLYNEELDRDGERPEAVERVKAAVAAADALLIATPEYNHSIPGTTATFIDWCSRPAFSGPLTHKPTGVLSATPGQAGGAVGQAVVVQALNATIARVLPHPGFAMGRANKGFAEDGSISDPTTKWFLEMYLTQFADWIDLVGR